ncbi:MAG: hypothetical protein JO023_05855, partial [Chloroflexi bacterium]|nr:hypothetical protein [Chloroflexota bacterium]
MSRSTSPEVVVDVSTPCAAPSWALLERQLLDAQSRACERFYERYFDERGYLRCVPRWSGDDGPDDALENVLNWTVLYALGGSDRVLTLYRRALEGHFRQYAEAKTSEVELGREGMYYQEFHSCFDWFHHGEAWSVIFLQGLAEPRDESLIRRVRRWSSWYMGDDPHVPNYDAEHRVIRSFFNGSRGPLLRPATALDWAGDPIDVAGRFDTLHGETSYQEMLDHFRDYTDVVGDNHVNLGATTLGLVAYALTGEARYRNWTLDYLDAWAERTRQNDGLIPSSVGLDGRVESGYGWYGGVYGWGFSVMEIPWRGQVAHRAVHLRTPFAFANALLLTGRRAYVELWRQVIDRVNAHARDEAGRIRYPHMYGRLDRLARLRRGESLDDLPPDGPTGWYEFRPEKFAPGAEALWYWTQDRSALQLLDATPGWVRYLDGDEPDFPETVLRAELEQVRSKVAEIRADARAPDRMMSDDMNTLNPATNVGTLIQLMLGGLPTGRDVHALHAYLRYFDPVRRRAGLPEQVAALVEHVSEDEVTLQLVNLDPVEDTVVVVQAGAYAEHRITHVHAAPIELPVDRSHLTVRLAAGG